MPSAIACLLCSLRRVDTEARFLAYAVRIASMILRTARFLCVLYAEICVNATAAVWYLIRVLCVQIQEQSKMKISSILLLSYHYTSPTQLKGSIKERRLHRFRCDFSSCSESAEISHADSFCLKKLVRVSMPTFSGFRATWKIATKSVHTPLFDGALQLNILYTTVA